MRNLFILLCFTLAACAGRPAGAGPAAALPATAAPSDWRRIATPDDRRRIRDWRDAFTAALGKARASGYGEAIEREGALLQPDAAIAGGAIPPGSYRCRVIKLGAKGEAMLDYVSYPPFTCRIEQEGTVASFTKLTGSQRPVGLIFDHDGMRQIFLGTLMLGDERRAMDYGQDATRDMAGAVERIGPSRWRLILPWPRFESMIDVIELVPA